MVSVPEHLKAFVKVKITKSGSFDIHTYTVVQTDLDGKVPIVSRGLILDDNTYTKYPELITLIPRGLSVVFLDGVEVCRLDGLEKFDGSCPLDDDNDFSGNIFKQNVSDITKWANMKVEFLEKANGKMAIFKVFEVSGKYFILGGSKNVHVVVGIYETPNGTDLHHQIIKTFQNDIAGRDIVDLLGSTIVGEYVDGQHIIFTANPYLVYFSGPLANVKRLIPDQTTLPTTEQLQYIRNLENTEGAVIVYTNLDTGTIFRQKHKSIWYILIRVMREGLRHYTKRTEAVVLVSKVSRIFKKRSDEFLSLTDDQLAKWEEILRNFVGFIIQSKYDFSDLDMKQVGVGQIFHEFSNNALEMPDRPIDPVDTTTDYGQTLETPQLADYVRILFDKGYKMCIIMRGPTGSGKTYTLKKLFDESVPSSSVVRIFSTDDLFMTNGVYQFDPTRLAALHNKNFENFSNAVVNNAQVVCVDNTNILSYEYGRYIELGRNHGYVTVVLQCKKLALKDYVARSTHNVTIDSIRARANKYVFTYPIYYGVLFREDVVANLLKECGIDYVPVQRTILHVTMFYGREQVHSLACRSIAVGKEYTVRVDSLCTSKAGKFLKVSMDDFVRGGLHITLETNQGFKPVDVGLHQADVSVVIGKELGGIFGPIY